MKHAGTQTIETERLILRQFTKDDAPTVYKNWTSDPEVTRFLTWNTHASTDVTRYVIADWVQSYGCSESYNWAIVLKEINEPIGSIGVVYKDNDIASVEMGYCIGKKWWHSGITSEAFAAVIRFFFTQTDVNRIEAYHDARNPNSGNVMKKCGLTYEGFRRQAFKNNTGICDVCGYAILREDWLNKIILIRPSMKYAEQIMSFRNELIQAGESLSGCGALRRCETAEEWLDSVRRLEKKETCPEGLVCADTYIAVRECDDRLVGVIDLRHSLDTPALREWSGHIGYSVRPCERRKGYAKQMLGLVLLNAKKLGLEKAMVCCDEGNIASERTILACGGIYEKTVDVDGRSIKRFLINI